MALASWEDWWLTAWGHAPPVVDITAQSRAKISRVAPADSTDFTFTSDRDYIAYEAKIESSGGAGEGSGTLIESGGGGTATTPRTITITDAELEAAGGAEGDNIVKVFVEDLASQWST